jgi:DNA polymerase-3 subunit delta
MKTKSARPSKGPSFADLRNSLGSAGPGSLYLLYGNEPLLIDRAVDAIIASAAGGTAPATNHETYSGEESDARSIAVAAAEYPMLGERRIILVREAEKLREPSTLISYISDPSPTTTLVFVSSKPDFRQKLFLALKEKAFLLECRTPYDDRIGEWIESEVEGAGKRIRPDAAELLRLSAGRSLGEIANELEKLHTFVGEKKEITREDVAAVVGVSHQYNSFDLHRAIGRDDTARALGIVYKMLDRGENMTGCIVQMTHYFGKLWLLAGSGGGGGTANAAALIGVKPFFVGEYLEALRRYPPSRLERCFLALRDADLRMKTSSGTVRQIMTLLILHLTGTTDDRSGEY